jgi:hypothetical protein
MPPMGRGEVHGIGSRPWAVPAPVLGPMTISVVGTIG